MRRYFIIDTPEGERLATHQGRVIVATTEEEIRLGPSTHTTDMERMEISVSDWIKEHR